MVFPPCTPKGRSEEKNYECPKATPQDSEAKVLIQCYCDNTLVKPDSVTCGNDLFTKLLEYGTEENYLEGSDPSSCATDNTPWNKIDTYILKDILGITSSNAQTAIINNAENYTYRPFGGDTTTVTTKSIDLQKLHILLYHMKSTLCRLYNCTYPRKKASSVLNKTVRNIIYMFSILFILLIYGTGLVKVFSADVMQMTGWIFFGLCYIILFAVISKFKLQSVFIYMWVYVIIIFRILGELTGHNGWILPFLVNIGGDSLFSEELFFNFNFS
jgi:hypothetical protein